MNTESPKMFYLHLEAINGEIQIVHDLLENKEKKL